MARVSALSSDCGGRWQGRDRDKDREMRNRENGSQTASLFKRPQMESLTSAEKVTDDKDCKGEQSVCDKAPQSKGRRTIHLHPSRNIQGYQSLSQRTDVGVQRNPQRGLALVAIIFKVPNWQD